MRCPSEVFTIIKSGNIGPAMLASRDLFRIRPEQTGRGYSSKLSTGCQTALSRALIVIADQQFGQFKFQGISDLEFRNCYQFFNAVRDEAPVSLPIFREHVMEFYPKGLSYICYPQLLASIEPQETSGILHSIWGRGLDTYFSDAGEVFGELKVPYKEPLTLGEFSVYRLRMGHRTAADIMQEEILTLLQRALGLQARLLSLAGSDDSVLHLIHNLATFGCMADLEKFCREAPKSLS